MEVISSKNQQLIKDLCDWKINREQFIEKTAFKANYEQLRYLLLSVKDYINKNEYNQYFGAILWDLPNSMSNKEDEALFQEFLLCDFHSEHENMASAFQSTFNNNIENIPILLKAIDNIPKYLEPEDFKYPYVRKIIYAIGAQPQPESFLALEQLVSQTNDVEIKKLALHQLEKRKELGRWEYERNNKL
jgi:hypothetical protein